MLRVFKSGTFLVRYADDTAATAATAIAGSGKAAAGTAKTTGKKTAVVSATGDAAVADAIDVAAAGPVEIEERVGPERLRQRQVVRQRAFTMGDIVLAAKGSGRARGSAAAGGWVVAAIVRVNGDRTYMVRYIDSSEDEERLGFCHLRRLCSEQDTGAARGGDDDVEQPETPAGTKGLAAKGASGLASPCRKKQRPIRQRKFKVGELCVAWVVAERQWKAGRVAAMGDERGEYVVLFGDDSTERIPFTRMRHLDMDSTAGVGGDGGAADSAAAGAVGSAAAAADGAVVDTKAGAGSTAVAQRTSEDTAGGEMTAKRGTAAATAAAKQGKSTEPPAGAKGTAATAAEATRAAEGSPSPRRARAASRTVASAPWPKAARRAFPQRRKSHRSRKKPEKQPGTQNLRCARRTQLLPLPPPRLSPPPPAAAAAARPARRKSSRTVMWKRQLAMTTPVAHGGRAAPPTRYGSSS
ncbi:unnamed protein product [Phaeothamnion confervicola]